MDGERAVLRDDARRVVVAPGARARHHDHEVGIRGRRTERPADAVRVVRFDGQHEGDAPGLAGLGGEHQGVGVGDLSRPQVGPERPDLVTGRQDRHEGGPSYEQVGGAGRCRRGDVDGAQPVSLGQQQLTGRHVLADRAHVLVGRNGGAQLGEQDVRAPHLVHVLAHDDRVAPGWHRVAGVDDVVVVGGEPQGSGLARADGGARPDRDAVHGGRVEGGRRAAGPDGLGRDPADRVGERHANGRGPARGTRPRRRRAATPRGPRRRECPG